MSVQNAALPTPYQHPFQRPSNTLPTVCAHTPPITPCALEQGQRGLEPAAPVQRSMEVRKPSSVFPAIDNPKVGLGADLVDSLHPSRTGPPSTNRYQVVDAPSDLIPFAYAWTQRWTQSPRGGCDRDPLALAKRAILRNLDADPAEDPAPPGGTSKVNSLPNISPAGSLHGAALEMSGAAIG
jgi:hypothetical protein